VPGSPLEPNRSLRCRLRFESGPARKRCSNKKLRPQTALLASGAAFVNAAAFLGSSPSSPRRSFEPSGAPALFTLRGRKSSWPLGRCLAPGQAATRTSEVHSRLPVSVCPFRSEETNGRADARSRCVTVATILPVVVTSVSVQPAAVRLNGRTSGQANDTAGELARGPDTRSHCVD